MGVKIKPIEDRIVVEAEIAKDKTASGIIIPDSAKEKPVRGKIVAAGKGKHENGVLLPMTVKVGDTILYGQYAGVEINIDGKDYLIMRQGDAFATV